MPKSTDTPKRRTTYAYCFRTAMIGGGTSYDVYFRKADKPSYPLHGLTYATVVCRDGQEFFSVYYAIDPKPRWSLRPGLEKWDTHKQHKRLADRFACRIAKRAFPELKGVSTLPLLWADWSLESTMIRVPVRIALPE